MRRSASEWVPPVILFLIEKRQNQDTAGFKTMPTYEYICSKCDHEFEWFQSMKDEAIRTCHRDVCPRKPWGKGRVKRSISSGAGLIFKGSGFYITDYRSEGYKKAAKQEAEASKPAEKKSEKKSEKKTEKKAVANKSSGSDR